MKVFLFILILFSCKVTNSIDKNYQSNEPPIKLIINFLNENDLDNCCTPDGDCFLIVSSYKIDTSFCSYKFWMFDEENFIKKSNNTIDYNFIDEGVSDINKVDVDNFDNIGCIEFINDKVSKPKGTISFSPLIPYLSDNLYEVWMSVENSYEDAEFRFIIKKKNDVFSVLRYEYSDYCIY